MFTCLHVYNVHVYFYRGGFSKLFGSRKEKDTKSSSTSPSSLSPPPPTQVHVEEKKEELLLPTKTEDVGKKRVSELVADEVSHLSCN